MSEISLKLSDDLAAPIRSTLGQLEDQIHALLPGIEVGHVGATALRGALTKGDLDVVVRVPESDFGNVVAILGSHFQTRQRQNWTATFASFGDDNSYPLPIGIQVFVKDSRDDILPYLHEYLATHSASLAEYNRLKQANAKFGPEAYWKAKDAFFEKILRQRGERSK